MEKLPVELIVKVLELERSAKKELEVKLREILGMVEESKDSPLRGMYCTWRDATYECLEACGVIEEWLWICDEKYATNPSVCQIQWEGLYEYYKNGLREKHYSKWAQIRTILKQAGVRSYLMSLRYKSEHTNNWNCGTSKSVW